MTSSPCSHSWIRRGGAAIALVFAVLVALVSALATAPLAAAQQGDDPALDQVIDADQQLGAGRTVISSGHVDLGPLFVGGEWRTMIHDDSAGASVWRDPDETVLQVGDAALAAVPDDPVYSFLGVDAGAQVHVVSQTQQPGVVWIGWNTQAPTVRERLDRGATLTLLGVQGPGEMFVYLQSGNFGAPEVLWSSADAAAQPIWVDVNTHTHANWVFTEPGSYLVRVEVSAELVDGEQVSDVVDLRLAVGDSTEPDAVFAERFTADSAPAGSEDGAADSGDGSSSPTLDGASSSAPAVLLAVAAAAIVLAAVVVVWVWSGRRARRQAERTR
jgi:putative ABC transporter-associated repeat protein